MYDSRTDWRRPGRDYLDPELENVFASSLIEIRHPHHYVQAAFQVGTASIIAGILLLFLSAFGSTTWVSGVAAEALRGMLMVAALGTALTIAGVCFAAVSAWLKTVLPRAE